MAFFTRGGSTDSGDTFSCYARLRTHLDINAKTFFHNFPSVCLWKRNCISGLSLLCHANGRDNGGLGREEFQRKSKTFSYTLSLIPWENTNESMEKS